MPVACMVEKNASGQNRRAAKRNRKTVVTYLKYREKLVCSPQCTSESVVVLNNSLSDVLDAVSQGKTPQQVAKERVEAENKRYKKENCAGMSAGACLVKMYTQRQEELKDILSMGADFMPIVGDIKGFSEADGALGYLAAVVGLMGSLGDAAGKTIKNAEKALKAGDLETASKLLNKASNEIQSVKALDVGSYKLY